MATITAVVRPKPLGAERDPRNRPWVHDGERWRRGRFTLEARAEQVEVTRNGMFGGPVDTFRQFIPGPKTLDITIEGGDEWQRAIWRYEARGPIAVSDRGSALRVYVIENAHFVDGEVVWRR